MQSLASSQILEEKVIQQLEQLLGANFPVLIQTFKEDAEQRIKSSKKYHQQQNYPELSKTIHSLKGACLNIGATAMSSACRQLEAEIENQNAEKISQILLNLEQEKISLFRCLDN